MGYEIKDVAARGVWLDGRAPKPIFPKLPPEGEPSVRKDGKKNSEPVRSFKRNAIVEEDGVESQAVSAERKPLFTDEELRLGFKMGVILGEPVSRRMMPRKQKIR